MKNLSAVVLLILLSVSVKAQDVYSSNDGKISFFSKTPIENIDATSSQLAGAINIKTGKVFFKVAMKSFVFKRGLMQEHFNENYMESDKYPDATFSGQVNNMPDLTKDSTYDVTATGKLNMHGVDQTRTIKGTIAVKGGQVSVHSEFVVKPADHKIDIPTIVVEKIAEEINVTLDATMQPLVNKK